MASKFVLTAELALQAPKNSQQIINQINKQLSGVKIAVNLQGAKRAEQDLSKINRETKSVTRSIDGMSRSFAIATRRFAAFSVATRAVSLLTNKLSAAIDEAIKFQREMNKISQVTGKVSQDLRGLEQEITRLSIVLGTSSTELVSVARILSQAGFSASDLQVALASLAKTTLAPTFEDITKTAEGAVAIFNQFGQGAAALEGQLGAINAVAGKFAVESGDLIGAVRRVGGVFKSAGGTLNELIALFTSVRATTRESAESIATGIRTIFTRIQRPKTIEFLRQFGVELTDLNGRFVGPFEAAKRLNAALGDLEQGDIRFIKVGEELAGFRQIGKVIPLIQQFVVAEEARQVALAGSESLNRDAATAQQTLAIQIEKVKQEYLALVRSFADTGTFKTLVKTTLGLASAFAKILESLKPLLPLITTFAAVKIGSGLAGLVGSRLSRRGSGGPIGFASGGVVPGSGNRDTVPAMLTPGEFVIKKSSVNKLGTGTLAAMNNNRFAKGGPISKEDSVAIAVSDFLGNQPIPGSVSVNVAGKGAQGTSVLRKKSGISQLASKTIEDLFTPSKKGKITDKALREGKLPSTELAKVIERVLGFSKKTYRTLVEGFDADDTANFSRISDEEYQNFITRSSQRFGQSVNVAKFKDISFKSGISQSEKGKLFESTLKAFDGKPLKGLANVSERDAFDFKSGISNTGKLFNEIRAKKIQFVDAKVGKKAGINDSEFQKKILSELAEQVIRDPGFELLRRKRADEILQSRGVENKKPVKRASGGGISGSDTVPALLTPGEFVINKQAASKIGSANLHKMNRGGVAGFAKGGPVGIQKFQSGGSVQGSSSFDGRQLAGLFALQSLPSIVQQFRDTTDGARSTFDKLLDGVSSVTSNLVAASLALQAFGVQLNKDGIKRLFQFDKNAKSFGNFAEKGLGRLGARVGRNSFLNTSGALGRAAQATTASRGIAGKAAVGLVKLAPAVGKLVFHITKLFNPIGIAATALGIFSSGLNAAFGAQVEFERAIENGNIARAKELAVLKEVPGIVQLFGSSAAEVFQDFMSLFGSTTSRTLKLQAELSARNAKFDKEKAENAKLASEALEDFKNNTISATEASRKVSVNFLEQKRITDQANKTSASLRSEKGAEGFTGRNVASFLSFGFVEGSSERNNRLEKQASGIEEKAQADLDEQFKLLKTNLRSISTSFILGQSSFDQFIASTGLAASLNKTQVNELKKAYETQQKAIQENIKFLQALDFGLREVNGKAAAVTGSLQRLVDSQETGFSRFKQSIQILEESISSSASFINRGDLDTARETLVGTLESFGASADQIKKVETSLDALTTAQVIAKGTLDRLKKDSDLASNVNPQELVTKFSSALNEDLKKQNIGEAARRTIIDSLSIGDDQKVAEQILSGNFSGVIDKAFGELSGEIKESVLESLRQRDKQEQVLIGLVRKRIDLEREELEVRRRAIDIQLEASQAIEEFGGRKLTFDDKAGAELSKLNLSLRSAGLSSVQGGSPAAVAGAQRQLFNAFSNIQAQQGSLSGVEGVEKDNRIQLVKAQEDIISFSRKRISQIREELDIIRQKNALEKSSIQRLLSGDIESFFKEQGAAGAASALRSGDSSALRAFSASDIAGGLSSLEGQVTPQEFEKLATPVLRNLGLSARTAQVLSDNTPEQQRLNQLGRQFGGVLGNAGQIAADLKSLEVQAQRVTINLANSNGVGFDPAKLIDATNTVANTLNASVEKLGNTKIQMQLNPVEVVLKGMDFANMAANLQPFFMDVLKLATRNMKVNSGGGIDFSHNVVPKG